MKHLSIDLILLALLSSSAMAGTITFESPKSSQVNNFSAGKVTSPFMVKSQFGNIAGLEDFTEANGTFNTKHQFGWGCFMADVIYISNYSNGVEQVPQGRIDINAVGGGDSWCSNFDITYNTGRFTGTQDSRKGYCITPYLNGVPLKNATNADHVPLKTAVNCTSSSGKTQYTTVGGVDFNPSDANLKFVITYK